MIIFTNCDRINGVCGVLGVILEQIQEKRKEILYEYKRKKVLNKIVNNIGEIQEDEKNIFCIAKQDVLEKKLKNGFYKLNLYGENPSYDKIQSLVKYFKLNKNVHYVFEGIVFDKPVMIFSHYCDITFKNCVFNNANIKIYYADKIKFIDNKYYDEGINNDCFLKTVTDIGEINFIRENFINSYQKEDNEFGIKVNAFKIVMDKANINVSKGKLLEIKAHNIDINDTNISAGSIALDSDNFKSNNSTLKAEKQIYIGNSNNSCDYEDVIGKLEAPCITINGKNVYDFKKNSQSIINDEILLMKKRKELLGVLSNLSRKCNEAINEEIDIFKNNLENKHIQYFKTR